MPPPATRDSAPSTAAGPRAGPRREPSRSFSAVVPGVCARRARFAFVATATKESLSHPTGRLIQHCPENALDLDRVYEVALETGVALEVNGLPDRLDLKGEHVREAIAAGVQIVCSTDAHSVGGLGNMPLSVHTARRGGARAADVLNTRPLAGLASERRGTKSE